MWGWRTVEFDGEGITVKYYSPRSTIDINGGEYTNEVGAVSEVFIKNLSKTEKIKQKTAEIQTKTDKKPAKNRQKTGKKPVKNDKKSGKNRRG